MADQTRILLAMDTEAAWVRVQLDGLLGYARPARDWRFRIVRQPDHLAEGLRWRPAGVICSDYSRSQLAPLGDLPTVNLAGDPGARSARCTLVTGDPIENPAMAADYLLGLGRTHLAWVGWVTTAVAEVSIGSIRDRAHAADATFEQMGITDGLNQYDRRRRVLSQRRRLDRWLQQLPGQTAIIANDSHLAFDVVSACRRIGRAVPDDLALISLGDDVLLDRLPQPSISAVRLASEQIGYRAAEELERLLGGAAPRPEPIHIPALEIVERESTNVLGMLDPAIGKVVRYIKAHACQGANVAEAARQAPICRSLLERKFRKALGHTMLEEIHRVRFDAVRKLLIHSRMPLDQIAGQTGFRDASHLTKAFRKRTGVTPGQFRTRFPNA